MGTLSCNLILIEIEMYLFMTRLRHAFWNVAVTQALLVGKYIFEGQGEILTTGTALRL